jgi:RNA polymerase sigma-70 factor (ECF subfamily)
MQMRETAVQAVDWIELAAQIQAGDETGLVCLYRIFSRGLRYYLLRQIGEQDCDDRMHEILLIVLNALRKGGLREPQHIMSFVWTVARRQVTATIQQRVVSRQMELGLECGVEAAEPRQNPESELISRERAAIGRKALLSLPPRNREILSRFYLKEQTQEHICREMKLTETQFRLGKSRAKARFAEAGKLLARKPAAKVFRRLETARQSSAACA